VAAGEWSPNLFRRPNPRVDAMARPRVITGSSAVVTATCPQNNAGTPAVRLGRDTFPRYGKQPNAPIGRRGGGGMTEPAEDELHPIAQNMVDRGRCDMWFAKGISEYLKKDDRDHQQSAVEVVE
jgi:hypothetical protein